MSKILDNLYLGSYTDAKSLGLLSSLGITHVATIGIELKPYHPNSFKYVCVPAYDSPEYQLINYFDQIADFIHSAIQKEHGKVFVHCYWGISRSATLILAYLIKYHKMSLNEAIFFLKRKRDIIKPNGGFISQLEAYAKNFEEPKTKEKLPSLVMRTQKATTLMKIVRFSEHKPVSVTRPGSTLELSRESLNPQDVNTSLNYQRPGFLKAIANLHSPRVSQVYRKKNQEYVCKECGIIVFNENDILHKSQMNSGTGNCNAIYLKKLPWVGFIESKKEKIFCPNSNCNNILGVANQTSGKCPCGKKLEMMVAIHPLKVTFPRPKTIAPHFAMN